ncbi:MAG: hypothetical protein ACOY31_06365 [Bacillota bacterium]
MQTTKRLDKKLDAKLIKQGYPQDVLNLLDSEQKQMLVDKKATYITHIIKRDNLTDDVNSKSDVSATSLSNFTQSIVVSDLADSPNGRMRYALTYNWNWNYDPYYTLTDKFGMAWSDDFDIESAAWRYIAYGSDGIGNYATKNWTGSGMSQSQAATGAGWNYDIVDSFMQNNRLYLTYRHQGRGYVEISKWSNKSGNNEQASVVGKYFHQQMSPQATFTFSKTPSISITPTTSYDASSSASQLWTYNNYKY